MNSAQMARCLYSCVRIEFDWNYPQRRKSEIKTTFSNTPDEFEAVWIPQLKAKTGYLLGFLKLKTVPKW